MRAIVPAPPDAPTRANDLPTRCFLWRVHPDRLAVVCARLEVDQDELARRVGLTPALLTSMVAIGATGKNARRLVRGLQQLGVDDAAALLAGGPA